MPDEAHRVLIDRNREDIAMLTRDVAAMTVQLARFEEKADSLLSSLGDLRGSVDGLSRSLNNVKPAMGERVITAIIASITTFAVAAFSGLTDLFKFLSK